MIIEIEQFESRQMPTVTYHGGPIIEHILLQPIYEYNSQKMDLFLKTLVQSLWIDNLQIYGASRGQVLPSIIEHNVNVNILTNDKSYIIFTNNISGGIHSVNVNGAYYALVGYDSFNNMTFAASHEIAEMITDPYPGLGWYDDNAGEICDAAYKAAGDLNANRYHYEVALFVNQDNLLVGSISASRLIGYVTQTSEIKIFNAQSKAVQYDFFVIGATSIIIGDTNDDGIDDIAIIVNQNEIKILSGINLQLFYDFIPFNIFSSIKIDNYSNIIISSYNEIKQYSFGIKTFDYFAYNPILPECLINIYDHDIWCILYLNGLVENKMYESGNLINDTLVMRY